MKIWKKKITFQKYGSVQVITISISTLKESENENHQKEKHNLGLYDLNEKIP